MNKATALRPNDRRPPDGRPPDRLDLRVRQVCDAVGAFIGYWGFKEVYGRVWTLLALRRDPVTQVELAETLGVSRSLISGAMAELTERGLVRATSDHRNAPYEAVVDVWPSISDVLRDREWMLVEQTRLALEAAVEEAEVSPLDDYDRDRMRQLLRMTEIAQSFLRLLIGLRVPRRLEGMGEWLRNSTQFLQSLRELR
ncbi:MAG: MarR family transcriptional regulator [Myxococcota bacterium]